MFNQITFTWHDSSTSDLSIDLAQPTSLNLSATGAALLKLAPSPLWPFAPMQPMKSVCPAVVPFQTAQQRNGWLRHRAISGNPAPDEGWGYSPTQRLRKTVAVLINRARKQLYPRPAVHVLLINLCAVANPLRYGISSRLFRGHALGAGRREVS